MARKKPVKKGCPCPADMEIARGAGRKTNLDVRAQTFFLNDKFCEI